MGLDPPGVPPYKQEVAGFEPGTAHRIRLCLTCHSRVGASAAEFASR